MKANRPSERFLSWRRQSADRPSAQPQWNNYTRGLPRHVAPCTRGAPGAGNWGPAHSWIPSLWSTHFMVWSPCRLPAPCFAILLCEDWEGVCVRVCIREVRVWCRGHSELLYNYKRARFMLLGQLVCWGFVGVSWLGPYGAQCCFCCQASECLIDLSNCIKEILWPTPLFPFSAFRSRTAARLFRCFSSHVNCESNNFFLETSPPLVAYQVSP